MSIDFEYKYAPIWSFWVKSLFEPQIFMHIFSNDGRSDVLQKVLCCIGCYIFH